MLFQDALVSDLIPVGSPFEFPITESALVDMMTLALDFTKVIRVNKLLFILLSRFWGFLGLT